MRLLVALLWIISLFGMQAHALVPHHHYEELSFHTHQAVDEHSTQHGFAGIAHGQITHNHDHFHLHDHGNALESKLPRLSRYMPEYAAILPAAFSFDSLRIVITFSRVSHPFIPFKTGPPDSIASRGPPPVA